MWGGGLREGAALQSVCVGGGRGRKGTCRVWGTRSRQVCCH